MRRRPSSLLQVADGGMTQISEILQRMKTLAVQAQFGQLTDSERSFLQSEFTALRSEIDRITTSTKFNGAVLLAGGAGQTVTLGAALTTAGVTGTLVGRMAGSGTLAYDGTDTFTFTDANADVHTVEINPAGLVVFEGTINFASAGIAFNFNNFAVSTAVAATAVTVTGAGTLSFQVGVSAADTVAVAIRDVDSTSLGIDGDTVGTAAGATTASNNLDTAISAMNTARASLGALMSRFEFANSNIATSIENLDAAKSVLLDVDMAAEMSRFSSRQVLLQAGIAMLAQANQLPQNLLRLLQQ